MKIQLSSHASCTSRPSWDDYFMAIAHLVSTRSTCLRRRVGAVLVKDNRILCTGYNGAPSGLRHCLEIGCLRDQLGIPSGERHELCRGLHAEQNILVQAARHGVVVADSTLYCTTFPCVICAKLLINAGVTAIFYVQGYPDNLTRDMLEEAGISLIQQDFSGFGEILQDFPKCG
ncbi:MAG: cytidine/deoxycytidylate deaminase family protein [Dissulfuribacterales bacterium]